MSEVRESPLSPDVASSSSESVSGVTHEEYSLEKLIEVLKREFGGPDLSQCHSQQQPECEVEELQPATPEPEVGYVCFVCGETLDVDLEQLQAHVSGHCQSCWKCFHCDVYFPCRASLDRHLASVPGGEEIRDQSSRYVARWVGVHCRLASTNQLRRTDLFAPCPAFCKVCRAVHQPASAVRPPQRVMDNLEMLNHLCHHMGYFRFVCLLCADQLPADGHPPSADQLIDMCISQPHARLIEQHLLRFHCNHFFAYHSQQPIFQRYMFVAFIERNLAFAHRHTGCFDFSGELHLYRKCDIDDLLHRTPHHPPPEHYSLDDSVFEQFLLKGRTANLDELSEESRSRFVQLHTRVESIVKATPQRLNCDQVRRKPHRLRIEVGRGSEVILSTADATGRSLESRCRVAEEGLCGPHRAALFGDQRRDCRPVAHNYFGREVMGATGRHSAPQPHLSAYFHSLLASFAMSDHDYLYTPHLAPVKPTRRTGQGKRRARRVNGETGEGESVRQNGHHWATNGSAGSPERPRPEPGAKEKASANGDVHGGPKRPKLIIVDSSRDNDRANGDSQAKRKRPKKSRKHKRKKTDSEQPPDGRRKKKKRKKERKKRRASSEERQEHRKYSNGQVWRSRKATATTTIEEVKGRRKYGCRSTEPSTLFDSSSSEESGKNRIDVTSIADMLRRKPPCCTASRDDDRQVDEEIFKLGSELSLKCLKKCTPCSASLLT